MLQRMPSRFDILFVDATDTLLRVHGSVGRLYAAAARRHGFEAAAESIDRSFRAAIGAAPPACFPGEDPARLAQRERQWWHAVVVQTFAPLGPFARLEPFFDEVFEMFRTTAAWDLLPGARETLVALHAGGLRLGILSDMDARVIDVLEELRLRALFDPIVLSTRSGASKRDGALFPIALERAGVPPPRALHVGDSLTADVAAARRAGITPIWLDPGEDGGIAPDGVATARHWREIPAILERLERDTRT